MKAKQWRIYWSISWQVLGIIYRDVKPENILLSAQDEAGTGILIIMCNTVIISSTSSNLVLLTFLILVSLLLSSVVLLLLLL